MDICGVLVQGRPLDRARIHATLATMQGVEVHAETEAGHLVVTVEDTEPGSVANTLVDINNVHGVLAASLVYQYSEDDHIDAEVSQ